MVLFVLFAVGALLAPLRLLVFVHLLFVVGGGPLEVSVDGRAVPDRIEKLVPQGLLLLVGRDLQSEEASAPYGQLLQVRCIVELHRVVLCDLFLLERQTRAAPHELEVQGPLLIREGVEDLPKLLDRLVGLSAVL